MQNDRTIEKLSDAQLYALVVNEDLSSDIKAIVVSEFKKRNFSQGYIDQLALEFEAIAPQSKDGLNAWQKAGIIAFPFLIPLQAILANRFISKGYPRKWKQYWQFLTIGMLVWTALLFLIAKLFLKY